MPFRLLFPPLAETQLVDLKARNPTKYRRVLKCLGLVERDPKYPGLNSKRYKSLDGRHNEPIWESYVENNTPGAYRVFWHYGPGKDELTIVAITPHP